MLRFEFRHRPGAGRVEVDYDLSARAPVVSVIVWSERRLETCVAFTEGQFREILLATLALMDGDDAQAGQVVDALARRVACAEGALGNNTDTDSHPDATQERGGDCRISADESVSGGWASAERAFLDRQRG